MMVFQSTDRTPHMHFLNISLGRFSILASKEPDVRLGVQRVGRGEVEVDLPYLRLTFEVYSKSAVPLSQ